LPIRLGASSSHPAASRLCAGRRLTLSRDVLGASQMYVCSTIIDSCTIASDRHVRTTRGASASDVPDRPRTS
jgi:hypothetical protein